MNLSRGLGGLSKRKPEHVGELQRVASACAVADASDRHRWLWAEGEAVVFDESANEGGPGGGDEFHLDGRRVGGETAKEVGGGGRGDGEPAVGTVHHAAAEVQG